MMYNKKQHARAHKRDLGKDYVEKVKSLETGRCIINMAGTGLQIPPIEIQIPNVTDILGVSANLLNRRLEEQHN